VLPGLSLKRRRQILRQAFGVVRRPALVAVLMSPESEPARYRAVSWTFGRTGNSQGYGGRGATAADHDGHGSHHYAQEAGNFFMSCIWLDSQMPSASHLLSLTPIRLEMKRFRAQATGITTLKDRK